MEVHKFGGTSVSDWKSLVALVKSFTQPSIVVVSAFSGVTDMLLESIEAARGVSSKRDRFPEILALHTSKLDEMERAGLHGNRSRATELLASCQAMLRGVAMLCGEAQPARGFSPSLLLHDNTRDSIAAFGELLSASIISFALECDMIDSRLLIRTDDTFGNANVDFAATKALCEAAHLTSHRLVVVPGFIASTASGLTSVLGRGGSDYTATILGASIQASRCVIWTDVFGVYSADPRLVRTGAYTLPKISFRESKEMAFFGSKVLFSKMIDPCEKLNIPIEVRKTCTDPNAPFTLISATSDLKAALSCIPKVSIIVLSGSGMKGVVGMAAKLFLALKDAKASAIMIAQASSEQELCVVIDQTAVEAAVGALNRVFAHELTLEVIDTIYAKQNYSVVNLVLGATLQVPGVASRFFSAAASIGVNIVSIAQPASEMGLSVVVKESEASRLMQAFHDVILDKKPRLRVVLFGVGNVGSRLMQLLEKLHDRVELIASCSSKTVTLTAGGEVVPVDGPEAALTVLMPLLKHGGPVYFIDCTASSALTTLYPRLLQLGTLITANKQGGSSPLSFYDQLEPHIATGTLSF